MVGGGDVPPVLIFDYRRSPAAWWGFGFSVLFASVLCW